VWGREDGLVPLSEGERLHKDIAGSTMIVFDQCAHAPNLEKAGEFNAAVIKFLSAGAQ
jgi:pimeloyl-ACP methyl ester carboxylesterase